jgi:hypothetical protein
VECSVSVKPDSTAQASNLVHCGTRKAVARIPHWWRMSSDRLTRNAVVLG